jgi:hypothetical protein
MLQVEKGFHKFAYSKKGDSKNEKTKHYNPEQKVLILMESPENNVPVNQLAEKYRV